LSSQTSSSSTTSEAASLPPSTRPSSGLSSSSTTSEAASLQPSTRPSSGLSSRPESPETDPPFRGDSAFDGIFLLNDEEEEYGPNSDQVAVHETAFDNYIRARDDCQITRRLILEYSDRVELYKKRFGPWFEKTETFESLHVVDNALASFLEYLDENIPDDSLLSDYGDFLIRKMASTLRSIIFQANGQIWVGDKLMSRGPSLWERICGFPVQVLTCKARIDSPFG
jgi:hypothetical protein